MIKGQQYQNSLLPSFLLYSSRKWQQQAIASNACQYEFGLALETKTFRKVLNAPTLIWKVTFCTYTFGFGSALEISSKFAILCKLEQQPLQSKLASILFDNVQKKSNLACTKFGGFCLKSPNSPNFTLVKIYINKVVDNCEGNAERMLKGCVESRVGDRLWLSNIHKNF